MDKESAPSKRKEKEEAIFQAALKVIQDNGFHGARISDIAVEAGVSYGLVYHYFANKDALFDAILKRWWNGLFGMMEQINAKDALVSDKLKELILYFFDTYQRQPELVNIFITEISRSSANLTPQRLAPFKDFMTIMDDLIRNGQGQGHLKGDLNPRYLTYILLGSVEAFLSIMVLEKKSIKGNRQKERMAESILEVFLHGSGQPNKEH